MEITKQIDGKDITITIPDSKYWQERAKKRVSAYWSNADNVEKALNERYKEVYKDLEDKFLAYVQKHGTDGELSYTQRHIIEIMKQLTPKINGLFSDQDDILSKHLYDTYVSNYTQGLYEFSSGTKMAWSFSKIDDRAVQTAIAYPWSGESFSDRIYENKAKLVTTLRQEITSSLIRGDAPAKTARAISQRLEVSRKQATVLAQTETAAVLTASDKKMYAELDCDEYQFEATLDNRTSPICRSKDSNVYKVTDMTSGLNAPPMHCRCRSTTVPYYGDTWMKRISKRLDTGKVEYVPDISYKDWEKRFYK